MKIIAITLLCLLSNTLSASLDSLLQILADMDSKDSAAIVQKQMEVSIALWSENKYVSDSVLNLAVGTAERIGNDQAYIRGRLIKCNRMRSSPEKTRAYYILDSIASSAEISPSLSVKIKRRLGRRYHAMAMHVESVEIYEEAIRIAEENELDVLGSLMVGVSAPLIHLEQYFPAMNYLTNALKIPGDHHSKVYAALPNVYRKVEDWDNVVKYGQIGLDNAEKINNKRGIVFSLMQMGYAYLKKGMYSEASEHTKRAWLMSKGMRNRPKAAILLNILVNIELANDNLQKAISYEKELDSIRGSASLAISHTLIGKAHFRQGNIDKAIELCKSALNMLNESDASQAYDVARCNMGANEILSKCYRRKREFDKAFAAQSDYLKAKEIVEGKGTIINISKALNIQELAQQKRILDLEKEQAEELLNEKINRYKISGILGGLLLLLGGFTVFQLRKRNRKIAEQNGIISKALDEKDLLLREIHHRVKNNLQLISSLLTLQGRSIDDEAALQAINEGKSRVRSMALIHQDLYNKEHLTSIAVNTYLEKLTTELFTTYSIDQDRVSLKLDIDAIELDIDTLVPIGLIINELITNSLKYAFPDGRQGSISVSLKEVDQELVLQIMDNGVGIDVEKVQSNSFGATLVSALTDQLDGNIKIESEQGTKTTIAFKDYLKKG